jgi:hypothetical protein
VGSEVVGRGPHQCFRGDPLKTLPPPPVLARVLAGREFLTVGLAGVAVAQTKSAPASTAGTAGVQTRLQALHYGNVHDLRRGFDGQWVGKATQGNVSKTVTIAPDGTVIAR